MAIGKRNVSGSRLNKDAYIAMLALKDYGYDGDYMITSMQRSASENRGVGGVKDSLHTHGNACDFGVKELLDGSGDNESTAFMKWFDSEQGKKWKKDFNVFYKDETNKPGAAHHHFGFRGAKNQTNIKNYETYDALYNSKKNTEGDNVGLVEIGNGNVKSESFEIDPFEIPSTGAPTPGGNLMTDINGNVINPGTGDQGVGGTSTTTGPQNTGVITQDPTTGTIIPAAGEVVTGNTDNEEVVIEGSGTGSVDGGSGTGTEGGDDNNLSYEEKARILQGETLEDILKERDKRKKTPYNINTGPDDVKVTDTIPTGEIVNDEKKKIEYNKRVERREFESLTPQEKIDKLYLDYRGSFKEIDGDLIGRNPDENQEGILGPEDDYDRAITESENEDGYLSKEEWYNLNKENKTLPKGTYELYKAEPEMMKVRGKDGRPYVTEPIGPAGGGVEFELDTLQNPEDINLDLGPKTLEVPNYNGTKPEDESNSKENFNNTPVKNDTNAVVFRLPTEQESNQNNPYYDPSTGIVDQDQINKDNNTIIVDEKNRTMLKGPNDPSSDDFAQNNIDKRIENDLAELNKSIGDLETKSGVKYEEGKYKAVNLGVEKSIFGGDVGSVISINGVQQHVGDPKNTAVTQEQGIIKQEAYIYGPKHKNYVEGSVNIASPDDAKLFKAQLWMSNFDQSKKDFFKSILTDKERSIAKAEGMTAYKARKNAEFQNYQLGIGKGRFDKNTNNLIKNNNDGIDYDVLDYNAYGVSNAISQSKRFNSDLETKQSSLISEMEKDLEGKIEKSRAGVEEYLLKEFRKAADLGRLDGYTEDQMKDWYYSAANDLLRGNQEKEATKFNDKFQAHMKEWVESYAPPKLISSETYDAVNTLLESVNFKFMPSDYKRNVLDNVWVNAEKGLMEEKVKSEVISQMKDEFYGKYYGEIAIDAKGNMTPFAIEDFANNALEMGIEEDYEKLIRTKNRTEDQNEEVKALRWTINFAKKIQDNNAKDVKNKDWASNFRTAFSNKMGVETVPFIGFAHQIMQSYSLYELSKKDPKDLTETEKTQMDMFALKNQHNQILSDLSAGYRQGGMLADMIPYVGEFIITSPTFTAARSYVKKGITRKLNQKVLAKIKYASVKNQGMGAIKRRVSRGVDLTAFVAGTFAQTLANPQQYIKHFVDNMTDEMQFMHTTDGDELIDFLDGVATDPDKYGKIEFGARFDKGTGMGKFDAAGKAVGITWAEFGTERLGQMIPMFGKYFKKKLPFKQQELFKRISLSYYLNKRGLGALNSGKALKSLKKNMSWDGVIGEVFEEMINLPLSNMIMGKPLNENFDSKFVGDMFAITGIAQIAFGGLGVAANLYTGNKTGVMQIGYQDYDSFQEFQDDLKEKIKKGTLGDQKVKVTGSFQKFIITEKMLKDGDAIDNFDRTEYDKAIEDRQARREIEILNKLDSGDRKSVLEINRRIDELKRDLRGYDFETDKDKINKIQNEIGELRSKKGALIQDVVKQIVKKDVKKAQKMADKIYGKNKVIISELETEDAVKEQAYLEVMNKMGYDMDLVEVTAKKKKVKGRTVYSVKFNGKSLEKSSMSEVENVVKDYLASDGFVSDIDGHVYINTGVASSSGAINVVAHEMLHKVLEKTLNEKPELREAIADALGAELDKLGAQIVSSEMQERMALYFESSKEMQSEEKINLFLDALRAGDISMDQTTSSRIGDLISRALAYLGINARFGKGSDVVQFLKNFEYQFKTATVSSQLKKATIDGVKIKGNITERIKDVTKLIRSRKSATTRLRNKLKKKYKDNPEKMIEDVMNNFKFSKSLNTTSKQNKDELFANSNRALDEAMEMMHGIDGFSSLEVEDQAVEWSKLSKDDKLIIGYQVGLEWQMFVLSKVKTTLTEDAGVRVNDQGERDFTLRNDLINNITIGVTNENGVPFMVNTWNPMKAKLTTHLYGLIPLRIPAAARQIPGFFENQVSSDKARNETNNEPNKKEQQKGKDIKLYEHPWVTPFNDKTKYKVSAKEIHEEILKVLELGEINTLELNSYKDVRTVIPKRIIDMVFDFYGIVPKPGNLTAKDIKNAQMRIEFNYNFVFGNFPQGYNSENKSTGTTQVLMTERPTNKNKLKEPKNVFYEELEVPDIIKDKQGNIVEVKTKAKRPNNLKIQRKIKNPGKSAILSVFGITETKGSSDNLYKKEDNTSSRIRAVVMETAVLFVNQAVVEVENNVSSLVSQALNDGKAPFRFSKSLGFEVGRPGLVKDIVKYNAFTSSEIKSLMDQNPDFNDMSSGEKNSAAKEIAKAISQYRVRLANHSGVGSRKVIMPTTMEAYIEDYYVFKQEDTALYAVLKSYLPNEIDNPKGKKDKNGNVEKIDVKNIGQFMININRVAKNRPFLLNLLNAQIKDKTMTTAEAVGIAINLYKGMLQGASVIGDGSITVDKDGALSYVPEKEWNAYVDKYKKEHKGKPPTNRKQFFNNVEDFYSNFLQGIIGVEIKNSKGVMLTPGQLRKKYEYSKPVSENSKQALENPYGEFIERENQSLQARKEIEKIFDELFKEVYSKDGKYDFVDVAMMAVTMGAGMGSIMRKAANLKYIGAGVMDVAVNKRGSELEYEHMIPQVVMMLRVLGSYINTGKLDSSVWEGYHVAIIPKAMDTVLTKQGLRSKMPLRGNRYFNMLTFGNPALTYLISLDPKDKGTDKEFVGKEFVEAIDILTKQNITFNERSILGKAYRMSKSLNSSKGITVLDFDDTLATSKSLIRYTTPAGAKGTLTPEQYASTYQDLQDLGYDFDFSEFNKVVDGKTAPLFEKALKLQSKFGSENMFVLTARPAESAFAIFEFIKANGLNIPLKNITGLANSTSEAKALWIAGKVAEGYNDFYFADDALQNVQAVDNMLEQFDVKRKVQQAKLNLKKSLSLTFNKMLQTTTGIEAKKEFGKVKGQQRGKGKGKFRPFIPPGAEDFIGLLNNFIGKGKKGDVNRKFFEDNLINQYNNAYEKINATQQRVSTEHTALRKKYPKTVKKLTKKANKDYSNSDAIRVYLFTAAGYDIPGLSEKDQEFLVDHIEKNKDLKVYALGISKVTQRAEGYLEPVENWNVGDIASDLYRLTQETTRAEFLSEWKQNADEIFSEKNLNKIEAAFGVNFRSALEDMLYRMYHGSSRPRGLNSLTNKALNFINSAVSTIMFFNGRSAVLQTISFVNFINYSDNNLFNFGRAFANFPQLIQDFTYLFNSDYLKQRRSGMKQDLNAAEMLESVKKSKNKVSAMIAYILEKGFLPTKMADSFAISIGGAAFYRNRIKSLMKRKGMTKKKAEEQAMKDFRKIAEETQQSSRPDFISQQQASLLGHFVLAFGNTPMQYTRIQKKAALDIINGRKSSGYDSLTQSNIANFSRILYYGAVQNIIFYTLQTAMFATMFEDDDDEDRVAFKNARMVNGMIDTLLRGTGVYGAIVSMLKNYVLALAAEEKKGFSMTEANPIVEVLNLSPPLGSKARMLVKAQRTIKFNKDKIGEMSLMDINNPLWDISAKYIQVATNVPVDRILNKSKNVQEAMSEQNAAWQRTFLLLGWDRWGLGVEDRMREFKTKKKKRGKSTRLN